MKTTSIMLFLFWLMLMKERAKAIAYSECIGGYCYTLIDKDSGLDPEHWCANNGYKLLEITDKDIHVSVTKFIQQQPGFNSIHKEVLTGGRLTVDENWIRLNGKPLERSITVKPDENPTKDNFARLKRDDDGRFNLFGSEAGRWNGYICSGSFDCTEGNMFNGQCYKSYTGTFKWYEARNQCLIKGGDLASFDFITSNDQLKSLNASWSNTTFSSYWIGMRKEFWTWQGSKLDIKYSAWLDGVPHRGDSQKDRMCLIATPYNRSAFDWVACEYTTNSPFACFKVNSNDSLTKSTVMEKTTQISSGARKRSIGNTGFERECIILAIGIISSIVISGPGVLRPFLSSL